MNWKTTLKNNKVDEKVEDALPSPRQVGQEFVNQMASVGDEEEPSQEKSNINPSEGSNLNEFRFRVGLRKYKIKAENEEIAKSKLQEFLNTKKAAPKTIEKTKKFRPEKQDISNKKTHPKITVGNILDAVVEEIKRIIEIHPHCMTQSYEKWVSVLVEEMGEIAQELNDNVEGITRRDAFTECVQMAAALILLGKKIAQDNPERFDEQMEEQPTM